MRQLRSEDRVSDSTSRMHNKFTKERRETGGRGVNEFSQKAGNQQNQFWANGRPRSGTFIELNPKIVESAFS